MEDAAEKENQGGNTDLTPPKNERTFKRAFKSFVIPGAPKTGIDSYFDQIEPHIRTLIKNQLKEIGSTKIILTIWVRWKKSIEPLIGLHPEALEDVQDIGGNTVDKGRPASLVNRSPQKICMSSSSFFFLSFFLNTIIQP